MIQDELRMRSLQNDTIAIRPDDNGTFVAQVPAIPGGHAWGKTSEEAQKELVYVFEMIREEEDSGGVKS